MSRIYPTIINNHTVVLELKEVYDHVRIIDISGRRVMQKPLNAQTGKIILDLLPLNPGVYTIQLLGKHTLDQKVFVTE